MSLDSQDDGAVEFPFFSAVVLSYGTLLLYVNQPKMLVASKGFQYHCSCEQNSGKCIVLC